MPRIPLSAILLALLAIVPLLACAAASVVLAPEKAAAYRTALIELAAIALAAQGAVHWGFALSGGTQRRTARMVLGLLAGLAGWAALLLRGVYGAPPAFVVLLLGFALLLLAERRLHRQGLLPRGYLALRLALGGAALLALAIAGIAPLVGRIIKL